MSEKCKECDSLLNIIDTGFGTDNTIFVEPCNPTTKPKNYLLEENYLSEFRTEDAKARARQNLGINNYEGINKTYVDSAINNLRIELSTLIDNAGIITWKII